MLVWTGVTAPISPTPLYMAGGPYPILSPLYWALMGGLAGSQSPAHQKAGFVLLAVQVSCALLVYVFRQDPEIASLNADGVLYMLPYMLGVAWLGRRFLTRANGVAT